MLIIASAKLNANQVAILVAFVIVVAILALPMFNSVHWGLEYCYFVHARRFCRKSRVNLARWRCRPEFDKSGIKTEFTVFELDGVDARGQRKLIRLLIWIFGVRKILSDENYPESHED